MSWWLHLLVCIVVLYSLPRWGYGALQERDCQIVTSFSSPYVTPLFQGTANTSGCTSQERGRTSPKYKITEVHVIHIGGGETLSNSGRQEVTLHISPLQESGIYRNSTVFVLRSHQPVTWQIDTDRISNRTRIPLFISDNARIKRNSRVLIREHKIKDFPSQRTQLEAWVRENFNGMTSFVEIQHANHIYKKLGYDRNAPRHCHIASNFQSEATSATSMQRNDMSGCAVTENVPNSRDVHILVLKTNARYQVHTSIIDIKTKKGVARNRDVVLVLKSDSGRVNWIIKANSVRGRISIITNSEANQVDTHGIFDVSLDISVSGTERNLDMKQGKQLINWVLDSHGPANIISYAETMRANRFEVFIDGGGEKSPWPLYTTLNPESPLPSTVRPQDSHHTRGPRKKMSPFDHPSRTRNALNLAQTTSCSPDLVVVLRKDILQGLGIRKSHLSLRDRDCKANSNRTHFLLDTGGGNCRTVTNDDGDRITLENAVVVHRPDGDEIPIDDEIEGSAIYDHPGSGYLDDTHIDDEDFVDEEDTIKINVHCTTHKKQKLPTLKYQVNFFTNKNFTQKVIRFPYIVPKSDSRLYVETRVDVENPNKGEKNPVDGKILSSQKIENEFVSDPGLEAVIQHCWLTYFSEAGDEIKRNVIKDACLIQTDAQFLTSGPGNSPRFSFILHRFDINPVREYTLSCQLTICSNDNNYSLPGVKKCSADEQYWCVTTHMVGESPFSTMPTQIVHKGPVRFESTATTTEDSSGSVSPVPNVPESKMVGDLSGEKCEQVVRREGLEMWTVVGIAFATFIIGVLLTAGFWFIHTHTGPLRKSSRPRSNETSGESTPSSTAPITIHQIHT